jgi:PKHD-type hydroxylase
MILTLKNFLAAEDCDHMVSILNSLEWQGDKNDEPEYNELIKKHRQLGAEDSPLVNKYSSALTEKVSSYAPITRATQQQAIKPFQFNCYKDGDSYERHSDSAFMGSSPRPMRTDYTLGVFLTDNYEGGDLVLEYPSGLVERIRGTKGALICYNCGVMHRVEPVTQGERIMGIGWIESKFRNQEEREIAVSVETLYDSLKTEKGLDHPHTQELNSIYHNLCRRWQNI